MTSFRGQPLVIAIVVFCGINSILLQSIRAQDGETPEQMPNSNTGLRVLHADRGQGSDLVIVSRDSLGKLEELVAFCSAESYFPPLKVLADGVRKSKYEGSVGLELSATKSCNARQLRPDGAQLVEGDTGVVSQANVFDNQCTYWKYAMARYVSALLAPSAGNRCDASKGVQVALQDLERNVWHTMSTARGFGDEGAVITWKAPLEGDLSRAARALSLYKESGEGYFLRLGVHTGDSLSSLSEILTGYGTLQAARDLAARNGIADPNTIFPGQKIHFSALEVKPEILQSAPVLEKVVTGRYSVIEGSTWEEVYHQLWEADSWFGVLNLQIHNPDKRHGSILYGEISVPLEIVGWSRIGVYELDKWQGVGKRTYAKGVRVSEEVKAGLRDVFCYKEQSVCSLPEFDIVAATGATE